MALSAEEKEEYEQALVRTAGPRDQMLSSRVVPEDYKSCLNLVEREERTFEAPDIVPVRIIISRALDRKKGCPLHINMHGGGFYIPQNEDDDMYCAHLAEGIHGIVIDIDYATTHDYPFPVAFEQCYAVVKWAFEHADELGADCKRISAGGLSAGGNLTAAVALRAAGTGDFRLCLEVLDCAATDNYMALTPAGNERTVAFSELYCDGDVRMLRMPYCSPAYATDAMLVGMPKTLVIAAGLCPFKETNERLAGRLAAAGVEVTIKTFPESHHGFVVRMVDEWQAAQDVIIRYINESSL